MQETPVALVLGAVKGIGRAIAEDLLHRGIRVAATWFDWPESHAEMQAQFDKTGTDFADFRVDLRKPEDVERLMGDVASRFGRLDILVNNIERGGMPIVHGPYIPDQWDLEFHTTLKAKRWVLEAALPFLRQSGRGVAINISSIAALVGRTGPASLIFNDGYAAANRGIRTLTETYARIGAPEVRVNELMLGIFDTRHGPGTRGWGLMSEAEKTALIDRTLCKRTGNMEDIVKAVNFMIFDAQYLTGTVLRLDGGYCIAAEPVGRMPEGVVADEPPPP